MTQLGGHAVVLDGGRLVFGLVAAKEQLLTQLEELLCSGSVVLRRQGGGDEGFDRVGRGGGGEGADGGGGGRRGLLLDLDVIGRVGGLSVLFVEL